MMENFAPVLQAVTLQDPTCDISQNMIFPWSPTRLLLSGDESVMNIVYVLPTPLTPFCYQASGICVAKRPLLSVTLLPISP